jgi:hypothetical protein
MTSSQSQYYPRDQRMSKFGIDVGEDLVYRGWYVEGQLLLTNWIRDSISIHLEF